MLERQFRPAHRAQLFQRRLGRGLAQIQRRIRTAFLRGQSHTRLVRANDTRVDQFDVGVGFDFAPIGELLFRQRL